VCPLARGGAGGGSCDRRQDCTEVSFDASLAACALKPGREGFRAGRGLMAAREGWGCSVGVVTEGVAGNDREEGRGCGEDQPGRA